MDGFQFKLEDGGWLLIRFSGTEPIMRVYCETMHEDKVKAILMMSESRWDQISIQVGQKNPCQVTGIFYSGQNIPFSYAYGHMV